MASENLRDLIEREQRRSRRKVVQIAGDLGVHRQTVHAWIRGTKRPVRWLVGALAQELGVSVARLERAIQNTQAALAAPEEVSR